MLAGFQRAVKELGIVPLPEDNDDSDPTWNSFRGLEFWCFDEEKRGYDNCCFNHYIGLPTKDNKYGDNIEYPIYDYEMLVLDSLLNHPHTWIKKSAGLGITTIILRIFAWLCTCTELVKNKQIFIIAGTREEFSNDLKVKIEDLFKNRFPEIKLNSKYTELWLNKTHIKVYPTKNIKDLRGHTDVAYLFIDEADFFEKKEQEELPYVIKRYEDKSRCKIIMNSTPNAPEGLFENIEKDKVFKGWFNKLYLLYEWGVGRIYDKDFIEREKTSPEFEREYNGKYLGKVGNVFSTQAINGAIELGEEMDHLPINKYSLHIGGIDGGFSSSKTAAYIGELDTDKQIVRIIWGKEWDKEAPSIIADEIHDINTRIDNLWWFVDGSNRAFVNELKLRFGEMLDWEKVEDVGHDDNRILPIAFVKEHRNMLHSLISLMGKRMLAIPKRFDKLIISLRTATAKEYDLDKDDTINDDSLDALRLITMGVRYGNK